MNTTLEQTTMRKVAIRLVPFLCVLYTIAFIDRINVGFAALSMSADLGLSPAAFGLGAGLFFIGYFLFEVPSNLILDRVGARRWIARVMITWGILSACFAFVAGQNSFYTLRFLLGVAEAGFFPGVILYLTYWFPKRYRGRVTAGFMTAIPIASFIAAPLSGFMLRIARARPEELAMDVHPGGNPVGPARHRRPRVPDRPSFAGQVADAGTAGVARE